MHIAKLLVMVCVTALGASPLLAQRPDSAAQANAREKLREAEAQFDSQQGTAPATNAVPAPAPAPYAPPVAIQPAPAPAPYQPPVAPPPAVAPQAISPSTTAFTAPPASTKPGSKLSPATEQQLREQLHQAEAQLEGQQPSAPAVPEQPKPVAKTKPSKTAPTKVVKNDEWPVSPPPAGAPAVPPKKSPKTSVANAPAPAPIPTGVSSSKEQQLADLLQLYKSDKITPAEYHEQRAKILAEP
jgi:hypothetical protein